MGLRSALLVTGLMILTACAPRGGPNDTVSLVPIGGDARAARDAALRGDSPAGSSATATGAQAAPQAPAMAPGALGNDTTYRGQSATQVAATPPPGSYEIVQPQPLPSRPSGSSGPSVVGFALATDNAVGQAVYTRSDPSAERAKRACDRYPSDDLAQAAFLNTGGPEVDKQGLDPDGDGFACGWDPERFRSAVK